MKKPREWWAWLKDPSCVREDSEGQTTIGWLVKDTFRIEHCAFKVVPKEDFDELAAEKQHFETLYKATVVDCEREIAVLRAENEKYRNHIKEHCGVNECPACGERYYNQPDFETFHHVEIERNKLQDENKRLHERYKNIELANENMSRNDHVTFGKLLNANAELVEALKKITECYDDVGAHDKIAFEALLKHRGGK